MGRCICLCTYCEHHRPIEVQWAGGYHQLGHNEHRVPCLWPLERCRPPGKFWARSSCTQDVLNKASCTQDRVTIAIYFQTQRGYDTLLVYWLAVKICTLWSRSSA